MNFSYKLNLGNGKDLFLGLKAGVSMFNVDFTKLQTQDPINQGRLEKINPNFAILFLLDLSKFLGFYPSLENLEQSFFAIKNSYTAIKRKKNEEDYFNQKSNFLKEIIRGKKVIMPQKIRSEILKDFLKYYKLNYYNLDNVTSHLIIEELR